jgi:hypothetical protein
MAPKDQPTHCKCDGCSACIRCEGCAECSWLMRKRTYHCTAQRVANFKHVGALCSSCLEAAGGTKRARDGAWNTAGAAAAFASAAADTGKNAAAVVCHSTPALCTLASAAAATAPISLAPPATCAATAPTITPVAAAAHTAAASLLNPGGGGGGREGGGSPDAAPQPTVLAQPDNAVVAAAAPSQTYELRQPRSVPGQKQPRIGRAYQAELPHFQPSSVQDQLWVPNEVHTLLKQHDLILSTFTSGSPTPKRIPGGSSSTEQERTRDSNPQPCVC